MEISSRHVWAVLSVAVIMILAGFVLLFLGTESPVKLEFWEIKLESQNLGVVIMALGVVLVGLTFRSFVNGEAAKSEKAGEVSAMPRLGLTLSASALDGHPIIHMGESEVFCGGASITITFAHNHSGSGSITVEEIRIGDLQYESGSNPSLQYKIEADKIFGAGMKEPDRYSISLLGETVMPAKWQEKGGEINSAQGTNLLTASRRYPCLHPSQGEDVEMIEVRILAQELGYYELAFEVLYTVMGKRDRICSDPVRIYFE